MDNNQTTAVNTANKTAAERADAAVGAISTNTLEATPVKLNLPQTTPTVPDLPIYSFTTQSEAERQRQSQVDAGKAQQADTLGNIYAGLADIGTRGETTMKLEEAAGIPQLSRDLTEIENELMTKSLAFRREREAITTGGGSKAQIDTILAERGRKQNQELADLEVIRSARSNTLTNAQSLINRKVELEFADKQAKVDALKFLYSENKSILDKEDDRLFQQAIKREERGFEVAKQQYIQTETEKMRYVANAAQAGADNNTLKAIQGAKSLDELYSLPGIQRFSMSQAEKLDMAYKQAQISNLYDQINARGVEQYEAAIKAAAEAKEQADSGLQKSLAGAALALELQTADGLSSAIGFGIKKSALSRMAIGAGAGAAGGSLLGPLGTVAGAIGGAAVGFFAGPDAAAGTARADYEAKADQLAAMITLEGRSALKGQGTITDSEQALLARAETILSNKNVSEEVWLETLQETAKILNLANQRYAKKYGGIPPELGNIYGIGADGMPTAMSLQVDNSGNIVVPGGSSFISNEDFFAQ